jgi:hypothetical protein
MFWKKYKASDEKLDELGKQLLKASTLTNEELNKIANKPFSYTRLQANIEAKRQTPAENLNNGFAILFLARYAVPALFCVALFSLTAFWINDLPVPPVNDTSDDFLATELISAPVTVCNISTKSECSVSNNDVLSIVFQEQPSEKMENE